MALASQAKATPKRRPYTHGEDNPNRRAFPTFCGGVARKFLGGFAGADAASGAEVFQCAKRTAARSVHGEPALRALARELCSRAGPSSWLCHPRGGRAAGKVGTTSEPSRQRAFESSSRTTNPSARVRNLGMTTSSYKPNHNHAGPSGAHLSDCAARGG